MCMHGNTMDVNVIVLVTLTEQVIRLLSFLSLLLSSNCLHIILNITSMQVLYWNGKLVCTPALGLYLCVFLCVHVTSNVELRNYVISRHIVIERRGT